MVVLKIYVSQVTKSHGPLNTPPHSNPCRPLKGTRVTKDAPRQSNSGVKGLGLGGGLWGFGNS